MKGVDFVVRPLQMFMLEVDRDKHPNITQRYRFELKKQNFEEGLEDQKKRDLNNVQVFF